MTVNNVLLFIVSNSIVPECEWIILAHIERPNPFPLVLFVTKASKIFSFNSLGIPTPLSSIITFIGKLLCSYLVKIFIIPLSLLMASAEFFNKFINN